MPSEWTDADVETAIAYLKAHNPIAWERYVAVEKTSQRPSPEDADYIWIPLNEQVYPDASPGEITALVERMRDRVRSELGLTAPKAKFAQLPPEREWTPEDADRAVGKLKTASESFSDLWATLLNQERERGGPDEWLLDRILIFLSRHFSRDVRWGFLISLVELIRDRARAEMGLSEPRRPLEGIPLQRLWTRDDLAHSIECLQQEFPELWTRYVEEEQTSGVISDDVHATMEDCLKQRLYSNISFREMLDLFTLIRGKIRHDLGVDSPSFRVSRLK